jgi:hypothetical protein
MLAKATKPKMRAQPACPMATLGCAKAEGRVGGVFVLACCGVHECLEVFAKASVTDAVIILEHKAYKRPFLSSELHPTNVR